MHMKKCYKVYCVAKLWKLEIYFIGLTFHYMYLLPMVSDKAYLSLYPVFFRG